VKKLINIQDICQSFSKKLWQRSLVSGAAIAMLGTVTLPANEGNRAVIAQQTAPQNSQQFSQPETRSPSVQMMQVADLKLPFWVWIIGGVVVVFVFLPQVGWILGLIVIGEREVGIVVKKFSFRGDLPAGQLIALNGEAGYQADTLAPGWYFGYYPWQYGIRKEPVVVIPQGEIGLIIANDGKSIPPDRILGKTVPCDNFQNAREFLLAGGEKGRQIAILTAGTYRINTALFTIVTSANAAQNGMSPAELKLYSVAPEKVGIVTTLDGIPIETGAIAGAIIPEHDNFQNAQLFINGGGRRGLQEQIILSGSWNLNPWFAQVEQVKMTEIPIGYVGVVISFVGGSQDDVSGALFTHGHLVNVGDKGVWIEPLYPGKHPLNTRIMRVELVPTTNIVLNFSSQTEAHGYDSKLSALNVCSIDGFTFNLEVAQIIHVGSLDAPRVISRVGCMQNLVDHVLRPTVGNYFRNSAQAYTVLDFLIARSDRQAEASDFIRNAMHAYDVQAVDTLLGEIEPPETLMETLTDRKIAEEQRKTYEVQRISQTQRQELVRETSLADIQREIVTAEQGVRIAELQANAKVKEASGEAEAIRVTGQAKADAYRAGVEALGGNSYVALELMQTIGDRNVRVVPDVAVNGGDRGGGLLDGVLGMLLWNQNKEANEAKSDSLTRLP